MRIHTPITLTQNGINNHTQQRTPTPPTKSRFLEERDHKPHKPHTHLHYKSGPTHPRSGHEPDSRATHADSYSDPLPGPLLPQHPPWPRPAPPRWALSAWPRTCQLSRLCVPLALRTWCPWCREGGWEVSSPCSQSTGRSVNKAACTKG